MRYCGHFLIKAEGGAKNYERDHPLPLAWRPFTVVFLQRKGYGDTILNIFLQLSPHFTVAVALAFMALLVSGVVFP